MRVRGLKPSRHNWSKSCCWSHPMRVRGLKQTSGGRLVWSASVAPHAGAWIETVLVGSWLRSWSVAPHAGAWIETPLKYRYCHNT